MMFHLSSLRIENRELVELCGPGVRFDLAIMQEAGAASLGFVNVRAG